VIASPKPPYPAELLATRRSCVINVNITASVGNITSVEAVGVPEFARYTEEFIKKNWKFSWTFNGNFKASIDYSLPMLIAKEAQLHPTQGPN